MRRTNDPEDKANYRSIKTLIQKTTRQEFFKYINNIIEVGEEDIEIKAGKQKRFWNYIKALRKDNNGISPLKAEGKIYSEPKAKADILNEQYQSVFTREDTANVP